MPSGLVAAQVLAYIAAGLALVYTIFAGIVMGGYGVGAMFASSLPVVGAAVSAARFRSISAGPGTRVAALTFAGFMIFFGFSGIRMGVPFGLFEVVLGIAIVATLSPGRNGYWFRRPR